MHVISSEAPEQDRSMLDWDDLRFFLAVARHGTLATAARHLHVTQSTVSRRVASLQERMGVRLLQRSREGYLLTLAGQSIMDRVKRVESEALSVERAVAGHDVRLDGIVRVASSQMLASHVLAACFATMHARHPGLMIEAVADIVSDLSDSIEPDVLVRLRRFDQHDLIVRNIGTIAFGLYGSSVYLDHHGEPDLENGCTGHQLITLLDTRDLSMQASWLSEYADRAQVALRTDSYETQHWVAANGGGLALLPRFRADADPALRRLDTPVPIPAAEIWLGVHHENRQVPRVRAILDCVADAVRNRSALLNPPAAELAQE